MVSPFVVFAASLPLLFRLIAAILPGTWLEPYAYWSAETLNRRDGELHATTRWRNMGYWKDAETFPDAAEALARKLLEFADAPQGGSVLDVAHGAGESLKIHLEAKPKYLDALTSLSSESKLARQLVEQVPHPDTSVEFFVSSASYMPGKNVHHPLNPMRGFLGEKRRSMDDDEDDEDEEEREDERVKQAPPPYDLVYILDAIYHFPPAVPHYLASVFRVLREGSGVVAYTDILPPKDMNNFIAQLVLPWLLSVPTRNITSRPKSLEEYSRLLKRIGYTEIKIEDWSEHIWPSFARDLQRRGWGWKQVARVVERAEKAGWRFVAVRATRPAAAVVNA